MTPPDPDACEKIFYQEPGFLEGFHVGLDFTLLTSEAGPRPKANILGQTGPHKPRTRASEMNKDQDEKVHEELGTVDDVEQREPEAAENRRIHHRGWRIREMERRPRRGMGWISSTGRKGRRTEGQGER